IFTNQMIGMDCLSLWSLGAQRFTRDRGGHDSSRFIDIEYNDLIINPIGVVEAIYKKFGFKWNSDIHAAIDLEYKRSMSSEQRPVHYYKLSDFGLNDELIRRMFSVTNRY